MKKFHFLVKIVTIGLCPVMGWAHPIFQDYPAKPVQMTKQTLKLDQKSRHYRSLLKNLSAQPVNAAGQYVLETFGCGGGCSGLAAYYAKTGRGFLLPHYYSDCYSEQHGFVGNEIEFDLKSRLVIATGSRTSEIEKCEKVYYLLEDDRFKEIKQQWIY